MRGAMKAQFEVEVTVAESRMEPVRLRMEQDIDAVPQRDTVVIHSQTGDYEIDAVFLCLEHAPQYNIVLKPIQANDTSDLLRMLKKMSTSGWQTV